MESNRKANHSASTVILRELARATAFRRGHSVSFSPRVTPDGLGSGVHIHFSLWDQSGKPVSHDPARPFGIGKTAGQFLSGVVRHMPALCAFTAPSPVSCLRLVSHSWTGVWSNLGLRDREAGLRICPTFGTSPEAVARQFNFEYRPADATANPYLQLAVILRVGLAGIRDGLAAPQPTSGEDPETMTPEARPVGRNAPGEPVERVLLHPRCSAAYADAPLLPDHQHLLATGT